MAVPDPIERVVVAARRRLSTAGLVRRVVAWSGAAAALASGIAAVGRFWVLEGVDVAAGSVVAASVVAAVVWSVAKRPSRLRAALAVDRRLGGFDRVTTSLELADSAAVTSAERRQLEATSAWADSRDVTGVVRVLPDRSVSVLSALAVVVLAVLVLVPAPTDAALAEREADRQLIDDEAERIEALADEVPEPVSESLDELADDLRGVDDLEDALRRLDEAGRELREALDPTALARRTALAGLENSFAQEPIAEGESAAEQLRTLADEIAAGETSGIERAVRQLRDRAADAAGVDEPLSEALERAADQLTQSAAGTGDPAAAEESLRSAAEAVEQAGEQAQREAATASAAGGVGEARQRLSDRLGAGDGARSEGPDEGDGGGGGGDEGGAGQGDGGSGDSGGSGQGQGAGGQGDGGQGDGGQGDGGQGPGGGGGGGQGAGGQSGAGQGSGRGGSGMGSGAGSGDEDPEVAPERSSVFDPTDDALGDRERVDLPGSEGQGQVEGLTDGRGGSENLPLVPYSDRFQDYRDTALETLDSLVVPSSVRDVVRDYFTQLQP